MKQGYDKLNWKYNEMSENLNANNVSISTLETQMSLSEDNINKLKVNIDILTSKKQEILSDSKHPIKLDTKNKLNELINKKKEKDDLLTSAQDKMTIIDNDVREVNEKIRELTVKQSELNTDINNIKIEMAEIATNKSSLFDNSDFDKQLILKAIKNNDDMLLEDDEKELDKIKSKIDKLGAINLAAIDEGKRTSRAKDLFR